ncbi:putative dinucleotide-binding enzyme [Bradyrhizobium sp. i1.8.4]
MTYAIIGTGLVGATLTRLIQARAALVFQNLIKYPI